MAEADAPLAEEEVVLGEGEIAALEEEKKRKRELDLQRLDALGQSLAKTRAEAIAARGASGIEDDWQEDDEFYQGYDEHNRSEMRSSTWGQRPSGQIAEKSGSTRSTVFPNITGPYVDAAASRIADMLLPTDDRSWALRNTPIPDLVNIAKGKFPKPMLREAAAMYPGQPELAKKKLAEAVEQAAEAIAEAKEKADKAQTRIEDWHVECQWHAHVRLVIEDAARIGCGVLKGPVPIKRKRVAWANDTLQVLNQIKPGSKQIDPWNFYPDGACGENIHNGSYTWERDNVTRKQLRDLRSENPQEGDYITEQIDACLEEGPTRATGEYKQTPDLITDPNQKDKFEIWYFHGTAEKEDLEAAGCDCAEEKDPHVPTMIVMVNNRVIKAVLNPLDTGDFPYDVMIWRRRSGHWAGIGVARQIRTPQKIVTAGARNLMDNAGIAAGPMIVFQSGVVDPADGVAGIAPRKVWFIKEDADGMNDATKAIGVVKVDMLVDDLLKIIQLGLNFAEHVTGMPLLLQGQMGKAPDTLGGMQMLNNNASSTLRRLARFFDDRITEPHVRRYYVWLLLDPNVPNDEKGDYMTDARGSSALVERDLQNQAVMQMGNIVLDPRFGKDPKKWMDEYLKANRLDPKRFDYEDEDWQKIVENMKQGPADPRTAIAQLRAQTDEKLKTLELQFQQQESDKDRRLELVLAGIEAELDRENQTGTKVISLDKIKGMLAKGAMDIRSKQALFSAERDLKLATGRGI